MLREPNKPLSVEDVQIPSLSDDEVLIKVKAVGICQSDVRMWHGHEIDKLPIIPGHECSGVIERVGGKVRNLKPGDRVLMDYRITCGDCYYCSSGRSNLCRSAVDIGANINGGYAQYVAVPDRQAFPLPPGVTFEEGAIIGCAVVTAYHATRRVADFRSGESVAIIGIGGVGYHVLKFTRAMGASRIIAVDTDQRKLDRAAKLGAETVNPTRDDGVDKQILNLTNNKGVDVAFEAIGYPRTVEAAIRSVACDGRVVLVGICSEKIEITPWDDLMYSPQVRNTGREIQIRPSIDHLRTDLTEVISMVNDRRVDLTDSVTHRITLEEVNRGLDMMDKKIDNPIRIVMQPNGSP